MPIAYVDHLRRDSARFREVLVDAPADAPVPTCPDWTATDLLWHLAEVQWFWGAVMGGELTGQEQVDGLEHPRRPGDRADLLALFDTAGADLARAVERTRPDAPRWMWAADPGLHTAGYIGRRQAHEALIHRIDAELTAGAPIAPVDVALATDGVDEVLTVMFANAPDWVDFTATEGRVVEVRATETGRSWTARLGRLTGIRPGTDEHVDEASIQLTTALAPTAVVSGSAVDLDCWLWNRPVSAPLTSEGDEATLQQLGEIIAEGMQ